MTPSKMKQFGGYLPIDLSLLVNPKKLLEKIDKKLLENKGPINYVIDKVDELKKVMAGDEITLTNNEKKYITKVIRSLKIEEFYSKE